MKYIVYASTAALFSVGLYHRLQAARSKEPIDRRQEGWFLLFGIRLSGFALAVALYLAPAAQPTPAAWLGVAGYAVSCAWLMWMFVNLGRNLTDTVVTRRESHFVSSGPYRLIRNPMYSGILLAGLSLALLYADWLVAALTVACFVQLAIRTRIEERFLIQRFGDTYVTYMSEIGRFLPHIR